MYLLARKAKPSNALSQDKGQQGEIPVVVERQKDLLVNPLTSESVFKRVLSSLSYYPKLVKSCCEATNWFSENGLDLSVTPHALCSLWLTSHKPVNVLWFSHLCDIK